MKLFLDTEFSKLEPGAKLISIALVNENEDFFYAELVDTYTLQDCSDFVISDVLPFLKGGKYKMTSYDCSFKMGNWIEDQGDCIIASDAPSWDIPHLHRLLEGHWPTNLSRDQIYYSERVPVHIEEDLILDYRYNKHNALDDALIMKKFYDLKKY